MSEWKEYTRKGVCEMRPYEEGEDLRGVSVSDSDTPSIGGMIARNPDKRSDRWYVDEKYFRANFLPVEN